MTHRTVDKQVKEDQASFVSLWPRPVLFYRPVFLLWALSYAAVGSNFLMVYATPSNKDRLSGRPTCCKRSFDCSTASKSQVLFSPPSKLTGPYRPGRASERATKRSVWARLVPRLKLSWPLIAISVPTKRCRRTYTGMHVLLLLLLQLALAPCLTDFW